MVGSIPTSGTVTMLTNVDLSLTLLANLGKIDISTHKEDIMKALGSFFAGMFKNTATSRSSFQREWDKARRDASRYGPSHVAEVDAIFAREA